MLRQLERDHEPDYPLSPSPSFPFLHRQQRPYIMANSRRQYKYMPYRMRISVFIPKVKEHPNGI